MKKIWLVLLLFFFLYKSFSQNIFKKNYLTGIDNKFSLIELNSGNFLIGLNLISVVDSLGNIIHNSSFVNSIQENNSLLKRSENEYVLDGYSLSTCNSNPSHYPTIMLTDTNGQILLQKYYHILGNCNNQTTLTCINSDKGILTMGRGESTCDQCWTGDFFVLRTDSLLEVKWAKYYSGQWGGAQFGKQTADGGFIIGLNLRIAGSCLLKLDSLGNTLWCKSYVRPRGYIHDCLIETDGSYIVTGYTDSTTNGIIIGYPNGFAPKLFMMKVDTSGHVLWCKGFDSDNHWLMNPSGVINNFDNNYVIMASVRCSPTWNDFRPLLIKTNKNGDTLWTRLNGRQNYYYETRSIIQCSDWGYLMGGFSTGNYPQSSSSASYLYKTDSLGHSCNESWQPTYTYDLFPTDSDITLTSVSGAVALSAYVRDTTYGAIPTYNECTGTGISNPLTSLNNYSFHPNPSTGVVHITRSNAVTSDCYYSVFDNMGRLLIQQTFVNGNKDTVIDLSRYGKGIYLIKITEGIEIITKKVVIE